ncbi:hypothetical protein AMECASPLE_038919 [Ameca splendens]|uniref:Uncharacterized protein n=1 Tax=Ameca splendens TaxID=208324 RepID=A0ABV0YJT7_9TELE
MANTPSHRVYDPTQSKVRDLTFQFEIEAKENSASNQLRMTGKTDFERKEPRKVSQKSDGVMMRKVLDPMPTDARRISHAGDSSFHPGEGRQQTLQETEPPESCWTGFCLTSQPEALR